MYNNIMKSKSLFFKVILASEILRVCFPACKYTNTKQTNKKTLLLFEAWFSKHSNASKSSLPEFLLEMVWITFWNKNKARVTKENLD